MLATAPHQVQTTVDELDLSALLLEVGEAVAYVDQHWVVQYCNEIYLKNLGLTRAQVMGRTPFEYAPNFIRSVFFEVCDSAMRTGEPRTRIGFSKLLGRWLMVRVYPLRGGLVLMTNDATETSVTQYHLAQKALQDPLTGIGNKLALEQKIDQLGQDGSAYTITVLSLVRFKDINNSHGYAVGDKVLMEAAASLQAACVTGETLFRLAGDEFAVVAEDGGNPVRERAQGLLDVLRPAITVGAARVVLQTCGATVSCPADGIGYASLMRHAGLAVHEAHRTTTAEVVAYRPEFEAAAQMRSVLEDELRHAIDVGQFVLMIQPKVSLVTGAVIGGEALIRWPHPYRGLLAPGAFLGVAESIKAMAAIDQWVLGEALAICATLRSRAINLPISINLSVASLSDVDLSQRVQQALQRAGVPPAMLEIEIPEGALMHDVKTSCRILGELSAMGVRLSIDDFGTGYSSFAYLAKFPVHTLKIDRSFVTDITANQTNQTIVKAIVRLAHSLSLEVIAEGAEDRSQLDILRIIDCDAVQGYVFAKPLTLPDFQAFVEQRPTRLRPDPFTI